MRLGILGPLEVVADDGTHLEPAAARQRRLLLGLLVWRGEPVSIDRLVDIVWDGSALPRNPVGALRTYVTRLRAALDPEAIAGQSQILIAGPDAYTLDLNGHELDAASFEEDLARGVEVVDEDPGEALRWFERALGRWRGAALLEVADEHWAMPEAVRLEELRLTAVEHRLACLIETGAHLEALSELERHVREHPLRERPHGLLMVALDRGGRTVDATGVFRSFRERLADETGLDPSTDLEALHERLLAASGSTTFARTAVAGVWNELPAARTELIGRDGDVVAVSTLLASSPVVTLAGVGGVGKTRLAVEVARRRRDDGGNAIFVELDRITNADDVTDAVFTALRLPPFARAEAVDGLVRLLRSQRGLVVMDNCEHVLDAVAALVDRLIRECPQLTVLTTSREPVGLNGERVHRLASLDTVAGIALFRERALAVAPGQGLDPAAERSIEEICRRLDGIPLAIELAAARTTHMTVAEIADRLDERFWLLTGGRQALPRQQTLQATLDWSYGLLSGEEQLLLRAAAVFVDGFDVEALAAVADRNEQATMTGLASLVGKSLVDMEAGDRRARYRLLETVRLYGLDHLSDAGELATRRQAHAEHFLARALVHEPRINDLPPGGGERTMCRIRVDPVPGGAETDLANHFAALDWLARQGELEGLGRLAARVATVLGYRGFLDPERRYLGRDDVADALTDRAERALYLTASALHATYFGAFQELFAFARAGMEAATDPATRAAATVLATQASLAFDFERVPDLIELALRDIPEDAHNAQLLLRGQQTLHHVMSGHLRQAVDRLEAHAAAGDVFAAGEQMLILHVLGDDERVFDVPVPDGSGPEHTALWGYRWPLAHALGHAASGRHGEAAQHLVQAAGQIASSPVSLLDRDVLIGCAALAFHAGDHAHALQMLAAVGSRRRSPATMVLHDHYERLLASSVDEEKRKAITEVALGMDPRDVLDQELERLAGTVPAGSATHEPAPRGRVINAEVGRPRPCRPAKGPVPGSDPRQPTGP